MNIADPGAEVVRAATSGDLGALDAVLVAIQPGVFNLSIRILGQRDDAADATQEILLKVVTHLGTFRGEAAFTTWVYRVARNHLLTAVTRRRESPEVSLEDLAERLGAGLEYGKLHGPTDADRSLTPEDRLEATQVALNCTQGMLMALDREQRLIYVLDAVFELPSREAAEVLGLTPEAYRQRLSRVRARLRTFVGTTCGLVNPNAACRCGRQLPALRAAQAGRADTGFAVHRAERAQAEREFESLLRMGDAAAVFRAHPEYRVPEAQLGAIRAVLRSEGYLAERSTQ